ncbi:MAG: DUF6131 family protein [Solirubrobacteraceae bacterium]
MRGAPDLWCSGYPSDWFHGGGEDMIVLGVVLLIVGFIAKVAILWSIGIILLIVGLTLAVLGSMGRAVGGRRHYY